MRESLSGIGQDADALRASATEINERRGLAVRPRASPTQRAYRPDRSRRRHARIAITFFEQRGGPRHGDTSCSSAMSPLRRRHGQPHGRRDVRGRRRHQDVAGLVSARNPRVRRAAVRSPGGFRERPGDGGVGGAGAARLPARGRARSRSRRWSTAARSVAFWRTGSSARRAAAARTGTPRWRAPTVPPTPALVREHAPGLVYEAGRAPAAGGLRALPRRPAARTRPTTATSTPTAPTPASGPRSSRAWSGGAAGPTSSTGSTTPTRTPPGRARTGSGAQQAPCSADRDVSCAGPRDYPGFHKDDWEGYQVRIDPDGRAWARASSHGHYQGCKQRLATTAGCGRRAGPASRAGATPATSRAVSRRTLRAALQPRCPGGPARAHLDRGGPAAVPLETRARAATGRRTTDHAALAQGGVPGPRERTSRERAAWDEPAGPGCGQ